MLKNKRVLLTGASSGIGRALAIELAEAGADLLLLARRKECLESLQKEITDRFSARCHIVCGDLNDSNIQEQAVECARDKLGGIDILINNAGVGATARIDETSDELNRSLFEINYFALFNTTQKALPFLKESAKKGNKPIVVNLGSIVGLRGVPHFGAYGAAKFAVTGLSETLRAELAKDGIGVLLVCPGTTKSEFFDVLLQSSSQPKMPEHSAVSPEYVAKRIVNAMKKGKHIIVPYPKAVVLYYLQRICPRFVDWLMAKYA